MNHVQNSTPQRDHPENALKKSKEMDLLDLGRASLLRYVLAIHRIQLKRTRKLKAEDRLQNPGILKVTQVKVWKSVDGLALSSRCGGAVVAAVTLSSLLCQIYKI